MMIEILAPARRLPFSPLNVSIAAFFVERLRNVPRGQPLPLHLTARLVLDGTWTVNRSA